MVSWEHKQTKETNKINKQQIINGCYSYIVKYKQNNNAKLKHFFAKDMKEFFELVENWKANFCIYNDDITEIKQVMEVA